MSNKRDLKKAIRNICTELFTECASAALYCAKDQKENGEALLTSIVALNNNYICRVSHPEPGMKANAYYTNLIQDFNKEAAALIDQIQTIA